MDKYLQNILSSILFSDPERTGKESQKIHCIFLISQNISADLKGPKVKHKLHYGRCTGKATSKVSLDDFNQGGLWRTIASI